MDFVGTVVCSSIVLVVNKCRDVTAEKLKEGGLTEQTIRQLIEREIHDIKSKLEGVARTDLLTAIDAFQVGLKFLYEAIDAKSLGDARTEPSPATEESSEVNQSSSSTASSAMDTIPLAEAMMNIDLTELDGRARRAISNAKERFKMARKKATAASNNEALTASDRITALRYRVMATILEALDNPADALPECDHCLNKLNSLPAVCGSFKDELKGSLLNKEERKEIISTVSIINFVIYDVMQAVGKDVHLWSWPFVNTGEDKIDPLRDARVTRLLQKQGIEHFCVQPWSFGQDHEEEHKLKLPWRIANNTQGNFIAADNKDRNVKVFDDRGKFLSAFHHPDDDGARTNVQIYDVATDGEDSIYVLFERRRPGPQKSEYGVFVKTVADQHREFLLREELTPWSWYLPSLTVNSNNKVLVRGRLPEKLGRQHVIDVYKNNGQFVRSIGARKLKNPTAIAAANDDRVMVQDVHNGSRYVRVFSELGEHLFKVKVEGSFAFADIAFDHAREQIIVAGQEAGKPCLRLLVYTKDGRTIVRSIELDVLGLDCFKGITLAETGRVGIIAGFLRKQSNNPDNDSFITPSDAFIDVEHDYKVLVV